MVRLHLQLDGKFEYLGGELSADVLLALGIV
jgi:hypothetical protein